MNFKTRTLLILTLMSIIDVVVPLPIIGIVLIYVVLNRPPWFLGVLEKIYHPE